MFTIIINIKIKKHSPWTWTQDSPRPGPYGRTSAGGWELLIIVYCLRYVYIYAVVKAVRLSCC